MPYGLGTRLPIEHGPKARAVEAVEPRSAPGPWRALPAECRLSLVEQALKPANDLIDAYPLAL